MPYLHMVFLSFLGIEESGTKSISSFFTISLTHGVNLLISLDNTFLQTIRLLLNMESIDSVFSEELKI